MLPRIRPMRLRLVKEPFDHPDYIFELKMDGFRAIAYPQSGELRRAAVHHLLRPPQNRTWSSALFFLRPSQASRISAQRLRLVGPLPHQHRLTTGRILWVRQIATRLVFGACSRNIGKRPSLL
jgi:hypothetical protein